MLLNIGVPVFAVGDSGTTGTQTTETFLEAAERYYGENGEAQLGTLATSWLDTAEEVKAGQEIKLQIEWTLNQAATYSYTALQQPLFDTYDDTKIFLTLPAGVEIMKGVSDSLQNVEEVIPPQDDSGVWTLELQDSLEAESGVNGTIMVPLKINGNGERGVGEVLDFSTPARLETSFTIMDRMDSGNPVPSSKTYEKSMEAGALTNKTTITDDVWLIEKNELSAVPDEDKSTVTVTFELTVGLDNGSGGIQNDPNAYGRDGRVPFDGNVTLHEVPLVLDRQNQPIPAESITITPQFGEKTPIPVEVGGSTPVAIPVDTCEGKVSSDDVAATAPYLSKYTVAVVYPYEEFIANYYDDNQAKLNVTNTATLTYTLKGNTEQTAEDDASIEAGEVTQPAHIAISKYLVDINHGSELYSAENFGSDAAVTGSATFTITDEAGEPATLYVKIGDTYQKLSGNTVTIDPKGTGETNSTTGTMDVYMDPGTYTVTETAGPSNTVMSTGGVNNAEPKTLTVAAGNGATAAFYDKEQLGYITVQKFGQELGGTETALAGATFALYKDTVAEGNKVGEATTDSNGNAHFNRLPYGTYIVKEISAPSGYVVDTTEYPVILSEPDPEGTVKVVNNTNLAPVKLQKKVNNGVDYVNVDADNYQVFEGKFSLESTTTPDNPESFSTVSGYEALNLNSTGAWTANLPAYDGSGNVITYRFKEQLPEGWHAVGDSNATVAYSANFTLKDFLGHSAADPCEVIMQNDLNGSITLTKEFYRLNAGGSAAKQPNQDVTFELYRKAEDGTGAAELVKTETFAGTVSFTNLPRTDADGKAYLYYLVETNSPAGYLADAKTTGDNTADKDKMVELTVPDTTGTKTVKAWGPFDFTSQDGTTAANLAQTITVKNYEQKLPVTIKKVNDVNNTHVTGASFTIYAYDDDKEGAEVVAQTQIPSSGATVWLETNRKYLVKETVVPQGYHDVTELDARVIDLTNVQTVSGDTVSGDTKYQTITITLENHPDPQLKINKTLVDSNGNSTNLTGVQFEVYTKDPNGGYIRVNGYNGQPLTLASGTATRLPAGTYWLKEIVPDANPNNLLDPSKFPQLYDGEDGAAKDGSFYFGPVTVAEVTSSQNLTQTTSIANYSATGAVTVTKQAKGEDGTLTPLSGATIAIYKQGEADPVKTAISGSNGKVTFSGLDIYDENGDKITYVIKETGCPDGYTLSDTELTVQLEAGKTVTTDDLTIVNLPEVSFQVTKKYHNIWENRFTQKSYLMAGAQIALYEKQGDGSYNFVEMLATDDLGTVNFNGLAQDKEYVAVEYDIPDGEGFAYLEPINGKDYLSDLKQEYQENPPATLTASELAQCYYVTKAVNTGNPVRQVTDSLTNVEHWAQLNIEKYVLDDSSAENAPEDTVDGTRRPVNNASFDLYMEILPDDTDENSVLSFEKDNLGKYTLIGSYSSGTLYDETGDRQDGWFATDILKVSDTVVYWLVETSGGSSSKIDPANQITLIKRSTTNYTNQSVSIEDPSVTSTQVFNYKDDRVTKEDTENKPVYGGGGAMFSTVRMVKWAGGINPETGDRVETYTPLGNASFELYLAHADGTIAGEKLDTLTSGLDNDLSDADTEPETAWASSKSFNWNNITQYENDKDVEQDVWWEDAAGNGYARVILIETGTPAGYQAPSSVYRMIMYFDHEDGVPTETFNDVYYVMDANSSVELAEKQGNEWALYPTQENDQGGYTLIPDVTGAKQYRMVNWPVDNFAVTVNKYGYTYNAQTQDMTSQQLDDYFLASVGRTPLANVEMKLQRYTDGIGWQDFAYPNYAGKEDVTFTTDENGHFSFPKGLNIGRYRIIEVTPDPGYENIYDGTVVQEGSYYDARAYYFRVQNANVQISMYNPAKLSFSVKKTGTDNAALKNVTFTLKPKTGSSLTAKTADDGIATFTNVGSEVYVLSEGAVQGHSNRYLAKYFQSAYADGHTWGSYALKNFATANQGIFLGFTTQVRDDQVVVTGSINLDDYGIGDLTVGVQNPALGSLTIKKADANTGEALNGATFKVERKDFASWSGEENTTDTGWNGYDPTDEDNTNVTVDGQTTLTDLEPGIYKITEITAPTDYEKDATPKYVVLTGGMNKTVTITGQTISATGSSSAEVTFTDRKLVDLTVTKVIDSGALTVKGGHTFTFTLYDASKKQLAQQDVEISDGAVNGATGSATFTGLSQGATYYITETISGEDFQLSGVEGQNNLEVTQEGNYYKFTMPASNAGAAIKVTNTYLFAEVTILKVNGNTGDPLDGAVFHAYLKGTDGFMTNHTGEWDEKGNGEYTVRLPLTDLNGNTFRLEEWSAPEGYVLDHDTTEVTVKPGQVISHGDYDTVTGGITGQEEKDTAMLQKLIFPNYPGSTIHITKYDNTKGSNASVLEGVVFTLYAKDAQGNWQQQETAETDEDGMVTFTVNSNKVYAVTETVPTGYAGLQGLYDGDNDMDTVTSDGTTYYLLNDGNSLEVNQIYNYNAYNIRYVEMEIRKQDADNPNADPAPTAEVSVYEVDNSTSTTLTQAQVADIMASKTAALTDIEVNHSGTSGTAHYSYANADTHPTLGSTFVGGKTYLIVETEASLPQIRDNKQVVWYAVKTIPEGATEKQVVTLKNLNASVSQKLEKSILAGGSNPSLLTGSATLRYTLTPEVSNSYPLDSYMITDSGLSGAKSDVDSLDFDKYLKDKYSVEAVRVGRATHKTENYAEGSFPISAKVTFYDFSEVPQVIKTVTVDVSTEAQNVWLSTPGKKAKYVTVEYFSKDFKAATGYDLGQNFMPGQLTVRIVMDKQEGGEAVQAITEVTNTAYADLEYRPWGTDGAQAETPTTDRKTDFVKNTFGSLDTAIVSVSKESNIGSIKLDGGVATYTITISNSQQAKASMKQPFLVDLLPQGMVLEDDTGKVNLVEAPDGITIESTRVGTEGGETALFVFLSGELKPGESAKVSVSLKSTTAVATYGSSIDNYVIVGSREKGVQSQDNPNATSFKNANNEWPGTAQTVLSELRGTERLASLQAILDENEFGNFGFVTASVPISWTASSEAYVLKTGRGDRTLNTGFTSDRLSAVNNDGYMEYQLIFSNQSSTYDYTNVTFLDVLPHVGDITSNNTDRGSAWGMSLDSITSVTLVDKDGNQTVLDPDKYRVFYYNETIETDDEAQDVYAEVKNLHFDTTTLPAGWADQKSDATTAFAVALAKTVDTALSSQESCIVEYKLDVGALTEEELASRAWNNTVNNFVCNFWRYTESDGIDNAQSAAAPLSSNSVSGTILPEPVKVGGHIWIDKDADGVWDADESVNQFTGNAMVQKLLNNVEVRLNTYSGNGTLPESDTFDKATNTNWSNDAAFVFEGLDAASKQDGASEEQLYSASTDPLNRLNPSYLKGTEPKTYSIVATIPSTAGVLARATSLGPTTGYSREPSTLQAGGQYANEARDNNYDDVSTPGSVNALNSVSERFYLHSSSTDSVFDNTKDLGLVLYRDVTISKVAADNDTTAVKGAKFTVYGPFASEADANAATLDSTNKLKEVTTDENGKAELGELNWFQYYVIVETETASAFRLDGAQASSDENVIQEYTGTSTTNPAWVLTVPENTVNESNQEITISNARKVDYQLEATKNLTGKTLTDGMFQFELLDQSEQPIAGQTKQNVGSKVTFDSITANKPGTVTYYIREKIPTEAANNDNQYQGYTYDDRMYKAVVTIGEDSDTHDLTASVAYSIKNANGEWEAAPNGAVFENSYAATPDEYAPMVEKTFTADSETPVAGDCFTFELEYASGPADGYVLPADTTVTVEGAAKGTFAPITFRKDGTYTFRITEKSDPTLQGFGYTFDNRTWTLTVVAEDKDGVIDIVSHQYTLANQTSEEQATFTNSYKPKIVGFAPTVSKQITGESPTSKQTFRFTLQLISQNPANAVFMPSQTQIEIQGVGIADFGEIQFRSAGTYTFLITEKDEGASGYTYDKRAWTLTVRVTKELLTGDLKVSAEYEATDGEKRDDAAQFVNSYRKERFPEDSHPPEENGTTPVTTVTIPQTGDAFPLPWIIAALAVSLCALVAIPIIKRRRDKK